MTRAPQVIRERSSRVGEDRIACALVLDRDLAPDEIARFHAILSDDEPRADQFHIQERVVRFECAVADEAKWRLTFEIFLAKTFSPAPAPEPSDPPRAPGDTRSRAGLRKLHLG